VGVFSEHSVYDLCMIFDSKKLDPQCNQNSVLTMPWIAWGTGTALLGYRPGPWYTKSCRLFQMQ